MDPVILTAIISALATVLVAAIGVVPLLVSNHKDRKSTKRTLETVRDQVANSHTTNLRDELTEVLELTKQIKEVQGQHTQILLGHTEDIRELHKEDGRLSGRIDQLDK